MEFAGASTIKPEEREFVVDTGASMHMVSRKDLNYADLDTVKVSKSPTKVVTASGEVITKEEATVHVRELDLLFVTVMLLADAPAVLSLGKLCEDHGNNYHWASGQKPHLLKNGRRLTCSTANYVPVAPGLSITSSNSATPTSPTSVLQEAVVPKLHPASKRSESTSGTVRGDPSHEPAEPKNKNN